MKGVVATVLCRRSIGAKRHTRENHKYINLKGFRFRKLEGNALSFPYVGFVNIRLNEMFILRELN